MTFILFITFQAQFLAYVPFTYVPRILSFKKNMHLKNVFVNLLKENVVWYPSKNSKKCTYKRTKPKIAMLLDGKAHALLANLLKALGSTYFD